MVEAKHYANQKVGIKILRELIGARYLADEFGDYKLCIATSSKFTNVVKKSALQKRIELLDGFNLISELKKFKNCTSKDIVLENLLKRI